MIKRIIFSSLIFVSSSCSESETPESETPESETPSIIATVYIEEVDVPREVSSSETSFDIRLKNNTDESDISCMEIRYESIISKTSLKLTVKGYVYPRPCSGVIVPFGERVYTVKANPHFALGDFMITIQNPDYGRYGDLQKVVKIVE